MNENQTEQTGARQGLQGTGQQQGGQFAGQIREHMEVVDDQGRRLGRVDSIEGNQIKLTRHDSSDGQHHYVSTNEVEGIENDQIRLRSGATGQSTYTQSDS